MEAHTAAAQEALRRIAEAPTWSALPAGQCGRRDDDDEMGRRRERRGGKVAKTMRREGGGGCGGVEWGEGSVVVGVRLIVSAVGVRALATPATGGKKKQSKS